MVGDESAKGHFDIYGSTDSHNNIVRKNTDRDTFISWKEYYTRRKKE